VGRRNFFSGWICVGRSADIAEPGMQRAERAGDTTALLVRGEDGVLRAFAEVCRHRGHDIRPCGGSAQARAITCPYHSWSYRLDGELCSAAGYGGLSSFDKSKFPLRSLKVAEWHGFSSVDISGQAGPLDAHLAGLEERVAPYRLETLQVRGSYQFVIQANYKTITEKYQECDHCPSIHPERCVVSLPESGANWGATEGA